MAYPISATRLKLYKSCPQSYYFRYERGLEEQSGFGSPTLGIAVHAALKDIYQEWNYAYPIPNLEWFSQCWQGHLGELSQRQVDDGWKMLKLYYDKYVEPLPQLSKPLGVEKRFKGSMRVGNLEFVIRGQYDRLDYCANGLEISDYKTAVLVDPPDEIDIQLGLYDFVFEQIYHEALCRLSFIYLRTGEKVTYEVTPKQRKKAHQVIKDLAVELQADEEWRPQKGQQCDRCSYARYCSAMEEVPEPLPETARKPRGMQLLLPL